MKCSQTTVLVTQVGTGKRGKKKSPASRKASASERVQHRNDELD